MTPFDQFWAVYPRRVGKKACRPLFDKAAEEVGAQQVIKAAAGYAHQQRDTEQQYIAHPATWFRRGSYEDEYEQTGVDLDKWRQPTPEEARIYRAENPWMDRDPEWIPKDWGKLRIVS